MGRKGAGFGICIVYVHVHVDWCWRELDVYLLVVLCDVVGKELRKQRHRVSMLQTVTKPSRWLEDRQQRKERTADAVRSRNKVC